MNPEFSPFKPGLPAPPELFTGRRNELERLNGMVKAAALGNLKVGFVSGERGIGKTSLVSLVRHASEQDHNAMVAYVSLGNVQTLNGMLRKTFNTLLNSVNKPWHKQILEFFKNHIKKAEVGLPGLPVKLEFSMPEQDMSHLASNFAPVIQKLLDDSEKKSLLIILDNINGLASDETFAHWLKSTVDSIAVSEKNLPLCLILVGIEERLRELGKNNPSVPRIFDLINVKPWSNEGTSNFYKRIFRSEEIELQDSILELLALFTGGLPVFAHEIGDAVWRIASSRNISENEILKGIWLAADIIGNKYLQPGIFADIRSERYRSILREIAYESPQLQFRRADLGRNLTDKEKKAMDNFLRRMEKLDALKRDPEIRGGYQFPTHLHALYFHMEAQRAKQTAKPKNKNRRPSRSS